MSGLPLLLSLIDELGQESNPSFYGNDFGFGISPCSHRHYLQRAPIYSSGVIDYNLPSSILSLLSAQRAGEMKEHRVPAVGKDGLQVCIDVAQFKPNELNVKVLDNSIVIEGKHEEREDQHGFIQRQFVRRYTLPKGYDGDKLVSTLSSDGVLTISVPKPQEGKKSKERIVQIQQTGPAHLNVKQNPQEDGGGAAKGSSGDQEKNK